MKELRLIGSVAALSAAMNAFASVETQEDAAYELSTERVDIGSGQVAPAAGSPLNPIAVAPFPDVVKFSDNATAAAIAQPVIDGVQLAPPVPTMNAAPLAPTAPVTAAPSKPAPEGCEGLDIDGLPWDERIHTSGATKKVKSGAWRKRKGVSDELVAQVTAELKANAAPPMPAGDGTVPVAPPVAPVATPPVAPVATPPVAPVATPPVAPVATPPVAPVAVTPTPPMPAGDSAVPVVPAAIETDFSSLMMVVQTKMGEGTITPESLAEYAVTLGVAQVHDIHSDQAKMNHFAALLNADGLWS